MINRDDQVPFVARFATRLFDAVTEPSRHDERRQIANIHASDAGVPAPNALVVRGLSRVTKVQNETTDDE